MKIYCVLSVRGVNSEYTFVEFCGEDREEAIETYHSIKETSAGDHRYIEVWEDGKQVGVVGGLTVVENKDFIDKLMVDIGLSESYYNGKTELNG